MSAIIGVWNRYGLQQRTSFNTRVTSVYQDGQGRWIINDPSNGRFDGVIPAIGTCGDPKMPHIEGQEKFTGEICHSSQLNGKSAEGKKVIIIGGGASAVEGLEFVVHTNATSTSVLARSDKWIIPRNPIVDILLAFNIFGQETVFSWIPESILRIFFYRDLADLAPTSTGLFEGTPMVNSDVFHRIRQHQAVWLRGDVVRITEDGIIFSRRQKGVPKGGPGQQIEIKGDMIIMATGYHRPSLSFLPDDCFEEKYLPPAWYLQVFPPKHVDICANNCTYTNAIGTVGSWHIGIYTRLLLVFLVDPLARPQEYGMKKWIDMTRWMKSKSPRGAFDFFTYSELVYWFIFCVAINPFRWKWALFVFFGLESALPLHIVREERRIGNRLGVRERNA